MKSSCAMKKDHIGQLTMVLVTRPMKSPLGHRGQMCLSGRTLRHPSAKYATVGCPTRTDKDWLVQDLEASIEVGPHISVLDSEAMGQLQAEVAED